MQKVVIEFLHARSSPIAKAFAESLLLASLEADNVSVVQYLLEGKLVDATMIVYRYEGGLYTIFEMAIIKQSYEVTEFFVNKRLDLCHHSGSRSNALGLLIDQTMEHDRESTFKDRFLRLVNIALEQGLTVGTGTIRWTFSRFTDMRLAISLAQDFASKAPHELLEDRGFMREIIENLDEDRAMKIIKSAIEICQASDDFRRWFRQSYHVDEALDSCIERGHDELSRILLPYTSNPARRLSDAMGAGKQLHVDVIMQHNPDLYQRHIMDTTAFIAALRSGDESRIGLMEQGVLNHLGGRILGHALTAALEAGSLQYATKLLELDPELEFVSEGFDVTTAFDYALAHEFSSIAWKLLAAGVTTGDETRASILEVAIRREKADLVKAVIEFDPRLDEWDYPKSQLVQSALACNDDTIFSDVWTGLPAHFSTPRGLFLLTLRKGRRELFFQMFRCSLGRDPEHNALMAAVEYEDPALLSELGTLGAKADDDKALELAIEGHPSMVEPLLENYWKAFPRGRPGYGRGAISRALDKYSESPQILDNLLRWNLVAPTTDAHRDPLEYERVFMAVKTCNCDVVKKFLGCWAGIDSEITGSGITMNDTEAHRPLLQAIRCQKFDIVRLLLEHGADANKPAQFGLRRTALQEAAEVGDLAIVRLLLEHGVDVNAAPAALVGATALQLAAINGNCEIATILIEHGAQHDVPPPIGPHGRWPLEGAAEHGRFDMIRLLWDADKRYFEDEQCPRAVRLAERNGHIGCAELVAELKARRSSTHHDTLRSQTDHSA